MTESEIESAIELGPFLVDERIGEGGMGRVFGGRHTSTDVPVALKVVRALADDAARQRFHREVQSHARLVHPGITYLFEYGEVDEAAAERAGALLDVGSPFVAMERADRTVRRAMPFQSWNSIRRLVVQILDALAYSHARGVIHRDLKPENLLLFESDGRRGDGSRVALADFGIAHAFDREHELDEVELESAAGTPMYMAPEQLRGQWRHYGPWTDLYALGCIVWELVCGRPPFYADSSIAIATKQIEAPRPDLDPQFAVPDALASWTRRAMAVDPSDRFRRAADAAWALPRVLRADAGGPSPVGTEAGTDAGESLRLASRESDDEATTVLGHTLELGVAETAAAAGSADGCETGDREEEGADEKPIAAAPTEDASAVDSVESDAREVAVGIDGGELASRPPPVPQTWQPEHAESLPAPMVGAGLGLFGLREPPFVNRREACDRIWDDLRTVVDTGRPRFVYVHGDAGTGKSRLARWMATRAHEVGAARVIRAHHSRGGGPAEGIQGAAERTFRTLSLDRGELYEHLLEQLPKLGGESETRLEMDARALTEYLRPTDDTGPVDGPRYRFESAEQKRALAVRLFRRLARDRPVLFWIDDAQWGEEALAILEHLQTSPNDAPRMLVVATVRSDVLAEQPALERAFAALASNDNASRLSLAPLDREHQRELLEGLLPLESQLAETITDRTEGHPLFAMQLLGHLIDRGDIATGPRRFRIRAGRQLELPEDIHALWTERIDRLLDAVPDDRRRGTERALERAAALSREIDEREWRALCERTEFDGVADLSDRLVDRGLADRTDAGWSFAHGLLVDSIERRAREAGRWEAHNRACAELLEALASDGREKTARRRANHWVAAGHPERALDPLWEEYDYWSQLGDMERCSAVLERRRHLLDEIGAPPDDSRRLKNDLARSKCDLSTGVEPASVLEELEDLEERARRTDDFRVHRVLGTIAFCRQKQNELETAVERGREAIQAAPADETADDTLLSFRNLAWMEYLRGNLDEADRLFENAVARARESGHQYHAVVAGRGLAVMALAHGNRQQARRLHEQFAEESREAGFRYLESVHLNGLGELARFDGDAERATEFYRRYVELCRELHRPESVAVGVLNLALVDLMDGRFDAAAGRLQQASRQLASVSAEKLHARTLTLARLVHAAGLEAWGQFDAHLEEASTDVDDDRLARDHPWLLEMAGDYARDAGDGERARRAWEAARDVWSQLEQNESEHRVAEKLDALD